MGKIRVTTIGDEAQEEEKRKKAQAKREQKEAREAAENKEETPTQEDKPEEKNEGVAVVEGTPDSAQSSESLPSTGGKETTDRTPEKSKKTKKSKFSKARQRSTNYTANIMTIDKARSYPLSEGLELLRKFKPAKFDETVELHINTTQSGISGMVKLPHGTGKEIRVAIASDDVLAEVEKGKINFDVLIAQPQMMPKLARVAKVLGPRGLMPNPKNGTISPNPEEAARKFQGGQIGFKTEAKNPLMHVSVGKTSFKDEELSENIKTMIQAVKRDRILKVVLKSTMSPGIKLQV